jgi:hypothetical protein
MINPIRRLQGAGVWWRQSTPGLAAIVACVIVQALLGSRAGAGAPPEDEAGELKTAPAVVSTSRGAADVNDRLRRLEEFEATVQEQNRRLAEQNQQLAEQNRQLAEQNRGLARQLDESNRRHDELMRRLDRAAGLSSTPKSLDAAPTQLDGLVTGAAAPAPPATAPADLPPDGPTFDASWREPPFLVGGYDREKSQFILVQPRDPDRTPFALNFDLITELRYTGFARSAQTWTDSAGVVMPVKNFDTIEVNRNWFQFSGYALDPNLHFMAVVFNSSTNDSTLFLGWLDYRFNRALTVSAGYYKVPGSREWYDSFRYTLGADRTMATTFFRPNMSPGIWAIGEPITGLHYIAMVANSFNGLNLADNRIASKSNMAFATSLWAEPLGEFGPGPSDVEWHEQPALRIGSSLTLSREPLAGAAAIQSNPENTLFRLTDGTPLAEPGALAPGVQVTTTSVQLWAVDAAIKYRGLSFSGEYYFRWLDDFRHIGGPLAIRSLFASGAYAQSSYFLIAKRMEIYGRFSFVTGGQGGGDEWSGGLNWYVLARRNWRMTFDVTRINHSPAENELTGYRAGESGTLFQLQMLTDF